MKSVSNYLYKYQTFKSRSFFSVRSQKTPHYWTIRRDVALNSTDRAGKESEEPHYWTIRRGAALILRTGRFG